MTINDKKIQLISNIAVELVRQQTAVDVQALRDHAGKMYDEGKLAAEIAVKLIIRLLGIKEESRSISMVEILVDQAEKTYKENYAG